jgi:hypothetical protein
MGMTIGVITASTAAAAMRNANTTASAANPITTPTTLTTFRIQKSPLCYR